MISFHTLLVIFGLTVICQPNCSSTNQPDQDDVKERISGDASDYYLEMTKKSEWVDYGNMFAYDPLTQTNKEIKPIMEIQSSTISENKQSIQEKSCPTLINCNEIEDRLGKCETYIKLLEGSDQFDHCNKVGFTMIRRAIIRLSKVIRDNYSKGSSLQLTVNLDRLTFRLPNNIENSTNCDYLFNVDSLIDKLMSSMTFINPEPVDYRAIVVYTSSITGLLLIVWVFYKANLKIKIAFLIVTTCILVVIWEWFDMYQTQNAKNREILERLKDKCSRSQEPSWTDLIGNFLSTPFVWSKDNSGCVDYYIASYNNPIFQITPPMVLVKILEKLILHPIRLLADNLGIAVKHFFAHIPLIYFPPILIAAVFVLIYSQKYFWKSVARWGSSRSLQSNQEMVIIKQKSKLPLLGKKTKVKLLRQRACSTGDLTSLLM